MSHGSLPPLQRSVTHWAGGGHDEAAGATTALGNTLDVETWRAAAAHENAEWCDVVTRSHGCRTRFDVDGWTSATRTPPGYPDAVTLLPALDVGVLLGRIDSSAGCSVKDSFASLDLRAQGFRVLFEAEWIVRAGASPTALTTGPPWEQVHDEAGLVAWERAWRGGDDPTGLVGYERGDDLAEARRHGFEPAGPLRVWVRDD